MDELLALMTIRERIYKILSYAFYKEADSAYLDDFRACLQVFQTAGDEDCIDELIDGVKLMNDFYSNNIDEKEINELSCSFAKTFLVMNLKSGMQGVSPSESVYLSPEKIIMQVERDEVMDFYAQEGIARDKELFKEPEDHISAELYFMSQMSVKTFEMITKRNEEETINKLNVQREFLGNHLLKWIEPLCSDIFRLANHDFYKGLALITQGFIKWDYNKLHCILNED